MEDKIQMLNAEQKRYTIQEMQELKVSKYLLNIDAVLNKLPKIQQSKQKIDALVEIQKQSIDETMQDALQNQYKIHNSVISQTGYCCLKQESVPFARKVNGFKPGYIILEQMPEQQRRQFGKQIFDQTIQLLQILAFRSLFIKKIGQSVLWNENTQRVSLVPFQLSSQKTNQLEKLNELCYQQKTQLFDNETQQITNLQNLEDEIVVVQKIDFDLIAKKPFVKLFNQRLITSEQVLSQSQGKNALIAMARLVNEKTAVLQLKNVPQELHQYLKYDQPTPIPNEINDLVVDFVPKARMALGMHPTERLCQMKTLKSCWYEERLQQIMWSYQVKEGEFKVNDWEICCTQEDYEKIVDMMQ